MRELVLASAALLAVALTAPFAGAQYTDPATTSSAYETQVPDTSMGTASDPSTMTPSSSVSTTTTTNQTVTTQTDTAQSAQTGVSQSTQQTWDQGSVSSTAQAQTYGDTQTEGATTYGQASAQVHPVDLTETAELAGMAAVPMSPADVCQPRSVELADGTSRLNTSSRRHLIIAADHASVCEVQRVVIRSPSGRADAVRQTLLDHGVDDSLIEVQASDDGQLGVDMQFAGIAASTPQYAAMFNALATSYASAETQPYAQGATSMNQPSTYQTDPAAPGVEPVAYEPVEPAAPDEPQTWRPVDEASASSTTTVGVTTAQQPVTASQPMTTPQTTASVQTTTTATASPTWDESAEIPGGTY